MKSVEQILIENLTTAVAKIEAQDVKAVDPRKNHCFYIHPQTCARCLFGHLMETPDPDQKAAINGSEPLGHVADFLGLTPDDLRPFVDDLVRLQTIHDTFWNVGKPFKDACASAPSFYDTPFIRQLREALQ